MSNNNVTLKLLVDPKANRVVCAEAGKDFVDYLFVIPSLALATVAQLLEGKAGSLGKLCTSIKDMKSDFLQRDFDKNSVLKPNAAVNIPLLSIEHKPSTSGFYRCSKCTDVKHVATKKGALCPCCQRKMSTKMIHVAPENSQAVTTTSSSTPRGCVKKAETYMVMDNLEVKPMSNISFAMLLGKYGIKKIDNLEQRDVHVSFNKAVAILKASMQTKAVLTTVFL